MQKFKEYEDFTDNVIRIRETEPSMEYKKDVSLQINKDKIETLVNDTSQSTVYGKRSRVDAKN